MGTEENVVSLLGAASGDFFVLRNQPPGRRVVLSRYRRLQGNPIGAARALIEALLLSLPPEVTTEVRVTGSGGPLVAEHLGTAVVNEFTAIG